MNLRALAESDLAITLEDDIAGFGWPATLINPEGNTQALKVQQNNISLSVDPDSGSFVHSSQVSIVLRNSSVNIGTPAKKWKVEISDISGKSKKYIVKQSMPDLELGITTLILSEVKG